MASQNFSNAQYARQLVVEAFIVGSVTLVIGFLIIMFLLYLQHRISQSPMPSNANLGIIAGGLFLTGVVAHFGFEGLGINKYYLTESAAAKRAAFKK